MHLQQQCRSRTHTHTIRRRRHSSFSSGYYSPPRAPCSQKKILVLRAGKDVRHAVDETERERERDGVAIESEWSNGGGVEEEGGISRHAARAWGKKKLVLAIHVYSTVFFLYDPAFLSFWIDPRGRSGKRTALLLFFSFFLLHWYNNDGCRPQLPFESSRYASRPAVSVVEWLVRCM
jgi:hypothetical protein